MTYLLDTDICIYILNGPTARLRERFEQEALPNLAVSTLTEAELHYGAHHSAQAKKNVERVELFLAPLTRIPFDSQAAGEFARIKESLIRKGITIGAIDLLIAAIAKTKGFTLVTKNLKHFKEISGLAVENWI